MSTVLPNCVSRKNGLNDERDSKKREYLVSCIISLKK